MRGFLVKQGFHDIRYEPCGAGSPPDFLVDGRVGVEVRLLDKYVSTSKGPQGLDKAAISLNRLMSRLCVELGPPVAGKSWFLSYRFRRPLPAWGVLEPAIRSQLKAFRDTGPHEQVEIEVARRCTIDLRPASDLFPTMFLIGMWTDSDSGGFVVGELIRALQVFVPEKTRKIDRVMGLCPEFWLLFEDRIARGSLNAHEIATVREHVKVEAPWSRIILASPDGARHFEL